MLCQFSSYLDTYILNGSLYTHRAKKKLYKIIKVVDSEP